MEKLNELKRIIGNQAFSAQYQQDPAAPEGNRIRLECFGTYDVLPERSQFNTVIMSIDAATSELPSSDYSVCTVWGLHADSWYLADVMRERLRYPDLRRRTIELMTHWKADRVVIEKASNGTALFDDLFYTERYRGRIVDLRPDLDKEMRVEAATAELETGKFLLPTQAHWLEEFRRECRAFPAGRYDDQVDSLTQFVNWQKMPWVKSYVSRGSRAISPRPTLKQRIHDSYRRKAE